MIRLALMGLTVPLAVAGAAVPIAHADDARLASRRYSASEVVQLEGRAGVQASIVFAEDEHIENVAIGDSASWQVTPNKRANLLFVKPLGTRARTNMTVVTDKRSYFFDLVASPTARPVYALRFTYPDEPKKEAPGLAAALTAEESAAAVGEARPVDPARLNFAWGASGKAKLHPARVYDDGESTYLSWAPGTPQPAILIRNEKGEEGPVNFAVQGGVIVIEGVPGLIVLRSGKDLATLQNRRLRPAPVKQAPPTTALATATPAQER